MSMMTVNSNNQPESPAAKKGNWFKRNILSIFMFLLVLGITITLFIFKSDIVKLGNYGYLGIFLVSVFTNATIILPMPSILLIIPLGATFNPLYIGLASGFGGSIGEMTTYVAGYSGREIWHDNPNYEKAKGWLKKWGMLIVFVFALLPLPIDILGLAAGNLRFPAWKYFLPCWIGKTIKYIVLSFAGYFGWDIFIKSSNFRTSLIGSAIAIVAVLVLVVVALYLENRTWKKK
jgi:membrane protein DedA with SNARE-associated domain